MKRIVIFAALQWECAPVLRRLRRARRLAIQDCAAWRGECAHADVWLVKTGIGCERAERALAHIAKQQSFDLMMSTGCAGALAADLRPGDLAVASRIVSFDGRRSFDTDVFHTAQLQEHAQHANLRAHHGAVLCSPAVLATASAKQAAAARYAAVAVEMEGEALACGAAHLGVPFVSARAILDSADTELEHSGRFVDAGSGNLKKLALAGYVARHPTVIAAFLDMHKMMRAAQQTLNVFFDSWMSPPAARRPAAQRT